MAESVTGRYAQIVPGLGDGRRERRRPTSLYDPGLASFDMTGYTAQDARGFIRLFGLQSRGRRRLSPAAVPSRPPRTSR